MGVYSPSGCCLGVDSEKWQIQQGKGNQTSASMVQLTLMIRASLSATSTISNHVPRTKPASKVVCGL